MDTIIRPSVEDTEVQLARDIKNAFFEAYGCFYVAGVKRAAAIYEGLDLTPERIMAFYLLGCVEGDSNGHRPRNAFEAWQRACRLGGAFSYMLDKADIIDA